MTSAFYFPFSILLYRVGSLSKFMASLTSVMVDAVDYLSMLAICPVDNIFCNKSIDLGLIA